MVEFLRVAGKSLLSAILLAGAALIPASAADDAASGKIPDFMQAGVGWNSAGRLVTELVPVPGSPSPVAQDPRVKYVANNDGDQPTFRSGDTRSPAFPRSNSVRGAHISCKPPRWSISSGNATRSCARFT